MEKLTLKTGLFDDADVIIDAANAPVIDLTADLSDADWDNVLDQILDCDLVITA